MARGDLACQKSSTWRGCWPYATFACVGIGCDASFAFAGAAGAAGDAGVWANDEAVRLAQAVRKISSLIGYNQSPQRKSAESMLGAGPDGQETGDRSPTHEQSRGVVNGLELGPEAGMVGT